MCRYIYIYIIWWASMLASGTGSKFYVVSRQKPLWIEHQVQGRWQEDIPRCTVLVLGGCKRLYIYIHTYIHVFLSNDLHFFLYINLFTYTTICIYIYLCTYLLTSIYINTHVYTVSYNEYPNMNAFSNMNTLEYVMMFRWLGGELCS